MKWKFLSPDQPAKKRVAPQAAMRLGENLNHSGVLLPASILMQLAGGPLGDDVREQMLRQVLDMSINFPQAESGSTDSGASNDFAGLPLVSSTYSSLSVVT